MILAAPTPLFLTGLGVKIGEEFLFNGIVLQNPFPTYRGLQDIFRFVVIIFRRTTQKYIVSGGSVSESSSSLGCL